MLVAFLSSFAAWWMAWQVPDLPVLEVRADNTRIEQSCVVRIAPGVVIADTDGNGVLHIVAAGITVRFEDGTVLRGAADDTPGNELEGIGVRVEGHHNVTLQGLEVRGFRCGILATSADGLFVFDAYLHHNFRQRLKSTPTAEDVSDWLWPHENDQQQWRKNYGAGLCVEQTVQVLILNLRVREQQNGIILDRVTEAIVLDSDCSFLSGWGLAMWRTSNSSVSGNNFNFNIRGYSHGVYNRGQDSAGILMFEQCSNNRIYKNSATHCGDGIFAFSGREALGEAPPPSADFDYVRRGNNDNVFAENRLNYAAAHGLELTFGFGNVVDSNEFIENAICGFWGGYSQDTRIVENRFRGNGAAGYGLERGAINIDHSRDNRIVNNLFESTTCSVHLWSLPSKLTETPWGRANNMQAIGNLFANNRLVGDALAVQLRGEVSLQHAGNTRQPRGELVLDIADESNWEVASETLLKRPLNLGRFICSWELDSREEPREYVPVVAGGREAIIMTEWGPWDYQAPLLRQVLSSGARHEYEMLPAGTAVEFYFADAEAAAALGLKLEVQDQRVAVIAGVGGFAEYQLLAQIEDQQFVRAGWFLNTDWQVRVFNSPCDPRENLATWRAAADESGAVSFVIEQLKLIYGMHGPANLPQLSGRKIGIGKEAFGTIATTTIQLQPGMWRFKIRSDDGVRVLVDGKILIENWTWHAPTVDEADLEVVGGEPLEIVVEHFELDGFSTLELQIEPLP